MFLVTNYICGKKRKADNKKENLPTNSTLLKVPKLSESKLKDLTWSLDINENINPITRGDYRK